MKKIILPLLAGLLTFSLCALVSKYFLAGLSPFTRQVSMKVLLALVSLLVAVLIFRLPLKDFTLRGAFKRTARRYIFLTFFLGMLSSAIMLLFHIPTIPLLNQLSFGQYIVAVWFCSSICEEVFARGMVQGIAAKYTSADARSVLGISWPVLAGAIVFSLIHLSIYLFGGSLSTTMAIMSFTFFAGILCGLARQKSGLGAAIMAHIAFNIGGLLSGVIINIVFKLITGHFINA